MFSLITVDEICVLIMNEKLLSKKLIKQCILARSSILMEEELYVLVTKYHLCTVAYCFH